MTRFVNFRASDIAPNPKEVMYWVDLEEDPLGGIIKCYDEELLYWTTIRILEGSIVKVEERIQKWVSEKLQEVNDEIDEKIKQFDGRILIIEGDIRELKEGKQDKLTAGYGIDIDENNVISCIIDTSLYEIVTELPKDNINSNKIYILIEPSADAVNLLEDITVSEYLHSITEDEVVLELYPQSATDSHNYIAFNRDISARFTISSNITDLSVIWDLRQPGLGFNFSLSTGGISSGYIHAKQGFSEITCDVVSGCIVTITVDSASKNQFTEYVYTGDRWEILGQDLTPFALDTDLQNEIKRAVEVETDLNIKINRETARAKAEEARIEKKAEDLVKAEQSRAEGVEADLQQQINDEVSRAKAEEARIEEKAEDLVEAESDRAKAAEKVNADAIAAEITRATTRENAIDSKLDTEIARAKLAEEELGDRITSTGDDLLTEINRAKAAEATLQANITAELTRATTAEDAIRTNLTNEITRSTNEDNAIKARVTTAEGNISTIQTNLSPIKAAWDKQGQRDGLLVLGDNGLVKLANLPSYVDDVLDVYATYDKSATGVLSNIKLYKDSAKTQAVTPESGKIYIDVTGNYQFRWTGTQYVALGTPTVLGTITGTAYDGGEGNKNRLVLNSLPGTILTHTGTVNHNADNITWTNQQFVSKLADMTYGSEMTTTTKTFNAATTKLAGVMMPSDKVTITQARKIGAISHVKDDQAWTRSSTNVSLNFDCILPTSIENIVKHSVGIGAATTSLAGVMTAADKTKLDNLSAGTNSPYVKKSGDTMTGPLNLKGEQFDGNYALNLNNSDIIGVNNLVFADISNSPGEGVQFKRTNGNYDSLWAADGVLKFSPNGTRGTTSNYPATYKIWHEGNDGSGSGLDADTLDGSHASAFLTLSTDQTITGKKTFEVGKFVLKGPESDYITTTQYPNNAWKDYDSNGLASIRNALSFKWHDTTWEVGAIRGGNTRSYRFGIGLRESSTKINPIFAITSKPNRTLELAPSVPADAKNKDAGILFKTRIDSEGQAQDVILRHEHYDTFQNGYGIAISKWNALEAGDGSMYFYNTGRYISNAPTGTAPYQCVSTTVNTNLNADMVDGVHVAGDGKNDGLMRAYSRGQFTTANRYFGNGTVVTIDPRPTDDTAGMLSSNTTILSLGDTSIRNAQLAFLYENDNIRYRRCNDGGTSRWKPWKTIAFIDSNVASATKLQNSRTIWGQSFNGTANISGNMTGVGTISASGNVTAAGFVKSGSDNNHVLLAGGGTKALSTFASGGETNQNAYSIVKVGSTNVSATSKTDTLTLVAGSNVTITPDATNRKVTISATASPYTLPTATYAALGGIKLVDNTKQTVAANARTTTANRTYAVQLNNSNQAVVNVPWTDTNTTYGLASTTANGLLRQLTGSTVQFMRGDGNWSEPTRIINGTSRVSCAGSRASIAVAKSSIIDSIELNSVDHSVSINVATRFDIFIDGSAANFYMHAQGIETNVPVSSYGGFFDTSDARVKTNVKELDASKADKVRLVEFDRTDIEHHGYGVIAQELEEIYPEMVNTDKNGFKSVNYDELAMVKIKYLEDKIAKLENVINDLLNK